MKALGKEQARARRIISGGRIWVLLLSVFLLMESGHAQGQRSPNRAHWPRSTGPSAAVENTPRGGSSTSITVCVVDEVGFALDRQATVKLHDEVSQRVVWASTNGGAEAQFDNLTAGEYEIEAGAPGFQVVRREFRAEGNHPYRVLIALPRDVSGAVSEVRPGQILAPRPRKEVEKGIVAMREGKLMDAKTHLAAAYKLAPTNAEVNYVLGVVLELQKNFADAEEHLDRAVSLDPQNVHAQRELWRVRVERAMRNGAAQTPQRHGKGAN